MFRKLNILLFTLNVTSVFDIDPTVVSDVYYVQWRILVWMMACLWNTEGIHSLYHCSTTCQFAYCRVGLLLFRI